MVIFLKPSMLNNLLVSLILIVHTMSVIKINLVMDLNKPLGHGFFVLKLSFAPLGLFYQNQTLLSLFSTPSLLLHILFFTLMISFSLQTLPLCFIVSLSLYNLNLLCLISNHFITFLLFQSSQPVMAFFFLKNSMLRSFWNVPQCLSVILVLHQSTHNPKSLPPLEHRFLIPPNIEASPVGFNI